MQCLNFFAVDQNSDRGVVGSKLEHNFSQEAFLVLFRTLVVSAQALRYVMKSSRERDVLNFWK